MKPPAYPTALAANRRVRRSGFTLVELLIGITVIAILAGMLTVAVMPALTTARETSIALELKQLEVAIEQFKQKYGFYPPSFESGTDSNGNAVGIATAAEMLQYVNRISPNHNELSASGVGTKTRLEHWWDEVGQYLDQDSSLVFWLSGLCRNKQYPLTGDYNPATGAAGTPPLAAHGYNPADLAAGINEREVFYDFRTAQLVGNDPGELVYYPTAGGQMLIPASVSSGGFILEYKQGYAGTDEEAFLTAGVTGTADYRIKYRDAATYDLGGGNTAYYVGDVTGVAAANPTGLFVNPQSFQLITFGMDGLSGAPGNVYSIDSGVVAVGGFDFFGPWGADNICSFTDGRLQKYVNERK